MFKITKQYDLNDIWDILPQDQKAEAEYRKLSVVGRNDEKDSDLSLLLCIQNNEKTFLDVFTPGTLEVEPLTSWDEKLNIIWATTNPSRSLVAVSHERVAVVEKRQGPISIHVPERSYDSFVQTIGNSSSNVAPAKRFPVYHPTQTPQRVDFISEEAKTPRSSTISLLMTVFNEAITTYTVVIENKQQQQQQQQKQSNGSQQESSPLYVITKAPKRDIVVCNQFIWAQFVPRSGTLYSITTKQQRGKGRPLHEFRAVPMRAKRPLKGATEHVIPALFNMSSYFSLNTVYGTYPLPYGVGTEVSMMVTSPLPNVSVVSLSPAVTCICVQFEFVTSKEGSVSIPVSIIPLTAHTKIDFLIPLPGKRGEGFNEKTRVLFEQCDDFLVAYIPGVYAQLFDFSELHDPLLGISAEVPAHATTLGDIRAVAPLGDSAILGIDSSVIYRYELSKEFLLEMCASCTNSEVRTKVLHAACAHMRDMALAKDIIKVVLSRGPVSVEFLKEAIVGITFDSLRDILPYPILLGCPSTALQHSSFIDTFKENDKVESITFTQIDCTEKERGEQQRSYWRTVDQFAMAVSSQYCPPQPSGILQVISSKKTPAQEDEIISFYTQEQYGSIETITSLSQQNGGKLSKLREDADIEGFMKIMHEGGSYRNKSVPSDVILTAGSSINAEATDSRETDDDDNDDDGIEGYDYYDKELDEWLILDSEGKQSQTSDNDDSSNGNIVSFLKRVTTDGKSMTKAISTFRDSILALYPKLKQEVADKCAITYAIVQDRVVQTLLHGILEVFKKRDGAKQRARRDEANLFHVLENFLGALTEIGHIATPQKFDSLFSQLGCKFLSRQMFLQYMGRGLIKVTEDFVVELRSKRGHVKDPEFFYSCLFRLPFKTAVRLLSEGPQPPQKFFVEYTFTNSDPCLLVSQKSMTLDTDCEYSRFIPLSLFIKSLENQIGFIKENSPEILDLTLSQVMSSLSFDDFYNFISPNTQKEYK